jgi:hypothetical protein
LTYRWKKINTDAVSNAPVLKLLYKVFLNKYWIDELYEFIFVDGIKGIARAYRWFDDVIIDGIVNGIAKWTVAITHGVKATWEEGKAGSIFYLVMFALLSLFIGWLVASELLMQGAGTAAKIEYGLIGLVVSALAFFLFYAGVGGFDNKIIDGIVNVTAFFAGMSGRFLRSVQTGKVQTYLVFALFGVVVFLLWFIR